MPDIAKTLVATSSPLSICKGFGLFGGTGIRAGIGQAANKIPLVQTGKTTIATFRFSANVSIGAFAGICGPAYAVGMQMVGSYTNEQLALTVSDDEYQAGFFCGVNLTITFGLSLELLEAKWVSDGWKSRLEAGWVSALNLSVNQTFDVLGMIQEFILGKLSKQDTRGGRISNRIEQVADFIPSLLGSYGIFGEEADAIADSEGKVTVAPQIDLPINIVTLLRKFAAVDRFVAGLEKVGFFVSFGPMVSIVIPVDIKLTKFHVDGAEYSRDIAWEADGTVTADYTAGTVPAAPQQLAITLEHQAGHRFEYRFGVFFELNFFKIFNVGTSYSFAVPDLLGIKLDTRVTVNKLSAKVGQQTAGFDPLHPRHDDEDDDIEVVFEPLPVGA